MLTKWQKFLCFLGVLMLMGASVSGEVSNLDPDEEIVFFPSLGCPTDDGEYWEIQVRGCVFEPEKRALALYSLRQALRASGVTLASGEEAVLRDRARLFMVDNERGKRILVRLGERRFALAKSQADGGFSDIIRLRADQLRSFAGQSTNHASSLIIHAILPPGDSRLFTGTVDLVPATGLTVISDIDDTIKISNVRDRRALLRSSFLEPFRPVPGMAELYSSWATNAGAQFCYVSASPWQFYAPLSDFISSNGFPAGFFSLKQVRWKDRSLFSLFESPDAYKIKAIEQILDRLPRRQVMLVGDSGERDPEIYATLARRHPKQIRRIFIRDVTNETANSPRYQQAFRDLSPDLWQIFSEPASLQSRSMP